MLALSLGILAVVFLENSLALVSARVSGARQTVSPKSTTSSASTALDAEIHCSFILGAPLAGKGTQAMLLSDDFGCVHLSAGELLREERESGSELAKEIDKYIDEGQIVPVKITLDLLRAAMMKSGASRFLIDGFPRNFDNLEGWQTHCQDIKLDNVIFLDCPEDELARRLKERAKTSGRSDDNLDTLKKRLVTFHTSTMPVVEHFREKKILNYIPAHTREVKDVYSCVRQSLLPFVTTEIKALNQELVAAADADDWSAFAELCSKDCDAAAQFDGLSGDDARKEGRRSILEDEHVHLGGQSAVVSYKRRLFGKSFLESRQWAVEGGSWRHVSCKRTEC